MSRFQYQVKTEPVSTSPETVTESRWHQPWSEPVRVKPGLTAALQQFFAQPVTTPAAETVTVDKWFEALSERLYAKAGLPTPEQQYLAFAQASPFGETILEDKWHQPWSLPVPARFLPAYEQQTLAFVSVVAPPTPGIFLNIENSAIGRRVTVAAY